MLLCVFVFEWIRIIFLQFVYNMLNKMWSDFHWNLFKNVEDIINSIRGLVRTFGQCIKLPVVFSFPPRQSTLATEAVPGNSTNQHSITGSTSLTYNWRAPNFLNWMHPWNQTTTKQSKVVKPRNLMPSNTNETTVSQEY